MIKFITLIFITAISIYPQTEAQKKHPKFPILMNHYNAYVNANQKGNFDLALEEANTALNLSKEILGEESSITGSIYENIGNIYVSKKDPTKAIEYHEKALETRKKVLGENHPLVSNSYNNIGGNFEAKADYAKAIENYQKSLSIKKSLNENDPSVADSYAILGNAYFLKKEFDTSLDYFEKSLSFFLKTLPESHPKIIYLYSQIGLLFYTKGEFKKSIDYYNKIFSIQSKELGEEHPNLTLTYFRLALNFFSIGDYDKTIYYHEKIVLIETKTIGPEKIQLVNSYTTLGVSYIAKGKYDKGIEYLNNALKIRLKEIDDKHEDLIYSYSNLAIAYQFKGEYDKSIELNNKSLEILIANNKKENPKAAQIYEGLANSYFAKKDYVTAREYTEKSIVITTKFFTSNHPNIINLYQILGSIYSERNEYNTAIEYFKKSLELTINFRGKNHESTGLSYLGISRIFKRKKEFGRASFYTKKAINIFSQISTNKRSLIQAYYQLSEIQSLQKRPHLQISTLEKAAELVLQSRLELGNDKDFFTQENTYIFDKLYKLYIDSNKIEKAFQVTEKMRGLSILESFNIKFALKEANVNEADRIKFLEIEEKLEGLYSKRSATLKGIAQDANPDPAKENYAEDLWNEITKLQREEKTLEEKISKENPKFKELRKIEIPNLIDLQKKFGEEKKTFIEYRFVKDKYGNESLSTFVINGNESKLVKLGENLDLERKIFNLRTIISTDPSERELNQVKRKSGKEYIFRSKKDCKSLLEIEKQTAALQKNQTENEVYDELFCDEIKKLNNDEINKLMNTLSGEIFSILFQPILESNLILYDSIVISPDASLFTIPYASLKDKNNKYLSDRFQVSLIPSAVIWDKLKRDEKINYKNELFAIGNSIYEEGHKDSTAEYRSLISIEEKSNTEKEKVTRSVGITSGFDEIEEGMVNLEGSIAELETINKIVYKQNNFPEEHIFQGVMANKDILFNKFETKKQNSDYRIAHFSVHGLFFGETPELNSLALTSRKNALNYRKDALETYEKKYGKIKQDGFLKLGETIDLGLKCELVVMSACETSLGTQKAGEGLVGLPQGFLMGGANYVLATLWSVDDAGTQKFMRVFYTKVFDPANKNIPIPVLLKQTQRELSDKTINKYYHDPFYWSAFVVYGR
ncbi:MAG: tetratricopeptide repeat protein [Leptospiraceae bacterium]|nr:tetratricopeptide repeat protein [Leptospiraceae bacterium]